MYCVNLNPTPDFDHFDHVADGEISVSQEDFVLSLGGYSGRQMEMGELDHVVSQNPETLKQV